MQAVDVILGCGRHGVLSGIEVRIVFYPSLHLQATVCDYLPTRGFEGAVLLWVRSYGGCLYILAELCPILVGTSPRDVFNLAHGNSEICRFLSLGDRLYSIRAVRLTSMTGLISDHMASNQS